MTKTCFVVMGFGEKTDFQSNPQRVLNLNRTYENIIKPTVEAAGLHCIRADEIVHSTVIDKPMYEQLLGADLVIADLSTSNANALYELGVRHALRPHATIVMAEKNFNFPFDLSHVSMLKYEHLGPDIGFAEVMRVQGELKKKIVELVDKAEVDSPVFLFLPELGAVKEAVPDSTLGDMPRSDASFAQLLEAFREAKRSVKRPADWLKAAAFLETLKQLQPDDPYIVQQLALATYKSEQPDKVTALEEARTFLAALGPETSSDAETVGLWGAIHKRLWDQRKSRDDLDSAVRAYERGFYLKRDYYNGINYAFLLDVRAALSIGDDIIADRVLARRVRSDVLAMCSELRRNPNLTPSDAFWIGASQVEALLGLGRIAESRALHGAVTASAPEGWMVRTMEDQLAALEKLLPQAPATAPPAAPLPP